MPVERVPSGVASLDALLGGGFEADGLTEIYGEGGSGKTLLCLETAVRVARAGRWVLYIDTEGVSVDRLEAIAGRELATLLRRMVFATPNDLREQDRAVETVRSLVGDARRPVGLIVLDSATLHYRLTLSSPEEDEGRLSLVRELALLMSSARAARAPALFTNQVWRRPSDGSLEPLGGSFVHHAAKAVLRLDRLPGARRRAVLLKHRACSEGSAEFWITSSGLASEP